MMRRFSKSLLLAVVTLAIAGIASAGTISISPATQGPVGPSDVVTVDVVLNSVSDHVTAYGVHITWTAGLSFVGVVSSGVGFPGVFWQSLAGDETIDGIGLILRKADAVDPPTGGGVFAALPIATLQFHVTPGATPPKELITPVEDPVFDGINYYVGGQNAFTFYTDVGGEVLIPEPATALLLGLGLFGIAYAGRRR